MSARLTRPWGAHVFSSCGVWDIVTDRAFVAYVDSPSFGTGTFRSFLSSWLGEQGVTELFAVHNSGTQRRPAVAANLMFIQTERRQLRVRLAAAARDGKLPFTDGPLLGDFALDSGASEAELVDLDP